MSNNENENIVFYQFEKLAEQERKINSGSFLLTEKESALLSKAAECINKVLAPYSKVLEDVLLKIDTLNIIVNETFKSFEDNKINIKKLRSIRQKHMSAYYWSITPDIIKKEDKNGLLVTAATFNYRVTVSTDEKIKDIILPNNHKFFKAATMQERAEALGLDSLCLYVSRYELNTLDSLSLLFSVYDAGAGATTNAAPEFGSAFYPIISTNVMNLLNDIGANAKKPTITKKRNERGQQISISEYLTNTNNKVSFTDFNPYAAGGFISVGDPNTDKLLLQAQIITAQTGQQELKIPFSDFMAFRGYSPNYSKDAKEIAKTACSRLRRAGSDVDISDNLVSLTGGWNYVQKCLLVSRKGRGGSYIELQWTDDVYRHIMLHAEEGQQIEPLDKNIITIPDKYPAAYNIARKFNRHNRSNIGKANSHRLSVQTLINYVTSWPLYTENYKDIPDVEKPNYIKYPSLANDKIIRPFINTLNYLTNTHKIFERYTFTKNGKPVTDEELTQILKDYKQFITLNVDVVFCNEPNYKNLKEHKAKRQEIAEKANTKKKKKSNN